MANPLQERLQRPGVAQQGQQEEVHPVGSREGFPAAGLLAQPLHGEGAILLTEQDVGHLREHVAHNGTSLSCQSWVPLAVGWLRLTNSSIMHMVYLETRVRG